MPNSAAADDLGKLILRLFLGLMILLHGIHKLIHGIDGIENLVQGVGLPAAFAYGVYVGEVVGPLLLMTGWLARIGAGLITINMIVAILLVHPHEILDLTANGGWALELQGMFLFTALALVLLGPGRYGIPSRW